MTAHLTMQTASDALQAAADALGTDQRRQREFAAGLRAAQRLIADDCPRGASVHLGSMLSANNADIGDEAVDAVREVQLHLARIAAARLAANPPIPNERVK